MNHRAFLLLSYLLLSAMAVALVVQLIEGQWSEAAVLACFLILTAVFIAQRDRLPRVFSFLFAFAGAANAFGYAFNLWKTPVWFDEAVHAYTSFAVSAAIGWLMFSRTGFNASGRSAAFSIAVARHRVSPRRALGSVRVGDWHNWADRGHCAGPRYGYTRSDRRRHILCRRREQGPVRERSNWTAAGRPAVKISFLANELGLCGNLHRVAANAVNRSLFD